LDGELEPRLTEARAGQRQVFFVDAAHFVLGSFLCCVWSALRLFVRAASGRDRYNVLAAWNAVSHEVLSVRNTTYVTAATVCDLLQQIAARNFTSRSRSLWFWTMLATNVAPWCKTWRRR
jgi:hypothetical protein